MLILRKLHLKQFQRVWGVTVYVSFLVSNFGGNMVLCFECRVTFDKSVKYGSDLVAVWKSEQCINLYDFLDWHSKGTLWCQKQYESLVTLQETKFVFLQINHHTPLKTNFSLQVITFEGDMLFQGRDDQVAIVLLKTEIPDSNLETYTYRQFRACSVSKRKGRGFKATSLQSSNPKVKCHPGMWHRDTVHFIFFS